MKSITISIKSFLNNVYNQRMFTIIDFACSNERENFNIEENNSLKIDAAKTSRSKMCFDVVLSKVDNTTIKITIEIKPDKTFNVWFEHQSKENKKGTDKKTFNKFSSCVEFIIDEIISS
jgi:hypothetical protein